ncbi:MAG TPA: hypothetical protein VMH41_13345 [Mycobacteriales bacterium]|nr:hypothetical protein [Mycobacteriales bacterium]
MAVSGLSLAAAATVPASAGSNGTFHSTLTPKTAHKGTKLTIKGTHARKKATFDCLFVVIKGKTHYGPDLGSLKKVKSTKKGKVSCTLTFKPFEETVSGKARHCPLSKADKKAHYKCAIAMSTSDQKSNTIQYFTAKK